MEALTKLDGHINTYSGKRFNLLEPTADMVDIEDIARGLSFNSHFGGQTPKFFSIAQHSVMVYKAMPIDADPELKLLALMHDAAEAFIGDMVKPLKVHLPYYNEVEGLIMAAICERFSMDVSRMPEIKPMDMEVQAVEYKAFFKQGGIIGAGLEFWSPEESLRKFMRHFCDCIASRTNTGEGKEELLAKPVIFFRFSVRALSIFKKAELHTIGDVIIDGDERLRKRYLMGSTTLRNIIKVLDDLGLKLNA